MKELSLATLDSIVAFKLVWFRVACYFFIPAGMLFLTQTETYTDATWASMGAFLKGRLYTACVLAGCTSVCAYIDSSYQHARERSANMTMDREITKREEERKADGKGLPT